MRRCLRPAVDSFQVWDCEQFGLGDGEEDTTQNGTDAVQVSRDFEYYVYSAMRIQCYTEEHDSLVRLASVFIALWPVGVPVLFFVLLDRAQVRASERESKRGETTGELTALLMLPACVRGAAHQAEARQQARQVEAADRH